MDRWADLESIKRLKYRYLRCLDQKLWKEIEECFTEDATTSYADGKYSQSGRSEIVSFLKEAMGQPSFLSSHRVHQPEIDFTGETSAVGTWALEDTVIETRLGITLRGAGFYRDEYVKDGERWRLKHTGYRRTYEEIQKRNEVPGLSLTYGG